MDLDGPVHHIDYVGRPPNGRRAAAMPSGSTRGDEMLPGRVAQAGWKQLEEVHAWLVTDRGLVVERTFYPSLPALVHPALLFVRPVCDREETPARVAAASGRRAGQSPGRITQLPVQDSSSHSVR